MKWDKFIIEEKAKPYYQKLVSFLNNEEKQNEIYPSKDRIFACFNYFNIEDTKVVIVGQDPYSTPGYANGLAFAVNKGVETPKSLINIFKELKDDLGIERHDATLVDWACQGILLLNRVMTVSKNKPNSHRKQGWEEFTNNVIKFINNNCKNIVFVLWGNNAQELIPLIDKNKHLIITSSHPSPLGYYRSFKGSKPFSKINKYLLSINKKPINW